MSPADMDIVRRKLAVIVENLKASFTADFSGAVLRSPAGPHDGKAPVVTPLAVNPGTCVDSGRESPTLTVTKTVRVA